LVAAPAPTAARVTAGGHDGHRCGSAELANEYAYKSLKIVSYVQWRLQKWGSAAIAAAPLGWLLIKTMNVRSHVESGWLRKRATLEAVIMKVPLNPILS
jgi:hypothetical protein